MMTFQVCSYIRNVYAFPFPFTACFDLFFCITRRYVVGWYGVLFTGGRGCGAVHCGGTIVRTGRHTASLVTGGGCCESQRRCMRMWLHWSWGCGHRA